MINRTAQTRAAKRESHVPAPTLRAAALAPEYGTLALTAPLGFTSSVFMRALISLTNCASLSVCRIAQEAPPHLDEVPE